MCQWMAGGQFQMHRNTQTKAVPGQRYCEFCCSAGQDLWNQLLQLATGSKLLEEQSTPRLLAGKAWSKFRIQTQALPRHFSAVQPVHQQRKAHIPVRWHILVRPAARKASKQELRAVAISDI